MIVAVLASAGTAFYFYRTLSRVASDPATGCPGDGGRSITTILIDGSDSFTLRQQAFLRNHLEAIKRDIAVGGAIAVYRLGPDAEALLEPVAFVCNPGRGDDVNPLTASPRRAEKLWEETFQAKLQYVFDSVLDSAKEEQSPIFESIQSIGITTFGAPQWRDKPKRLILVSDMLHFTSEFSHYRDPGYFDAFRKTPYYHKVQTDLRRVDLTVFYVPRATRNTIQGKAHLDFWKAYFLDQGVRSGRLSFVHVEG